MGEKAEEPGDGLVLPAGTVTLLLGDIEGSTAAWESDPDGMSIAIARFDEVVSTLVEGHDGVRPMERGEGDSFVAVFPVAADATACAIALQLEFATADQWPFEVRMALHTGEVRHRDPGNYVGATINRCARIRAVANGGQILMSQVTRDLTSDSLSPELTIVDLGVHRLRDLSRDEHLFELRHPALPAPPAIRSTSSRPNNLPLELTSFVGREREIDAVTGLTRSDRMITLLGPGGCGKTRLSLHVAASVLDDHPDGVWFVELAPVDGSLVASTIANAVGAATRAAHDPVSTLADHLARRVALIVLDNCEHVIGEAARIATGLLMRCPSVRLLATSREPLGVPGELTFTIPSLSSIESRELFIERAERFRPNFVVDDTSAALIDEVCLRLDGIPLAIELAAARVRSLALEDICDRLSDRFQLLRGGARTLMARQQTLRASVDWSYDLLTSDERTALRRLSVFGGGFDLDAAASVIGRDLAEDPVDLVASLVEKSLVSLHDNQNDTRSRYGMLETIRQYGREKLDEAGDTLPTMDRFRQHTSASLRRAAAEEEGPDQAQWSARIKSELDNIRVVLRDALERGDGSELLDLVCLTGNTWTLSGATTEHRAWVQQALAIAPDDAPARASALYQLGVTDNFRGDIRSAIDNIGASVPLYRANGDVPGELWALAEYACNLAFGEGLAVARLVYDDAIARATALREDGVLLSLDYGLGMVLAYTGRLTEALEILERAAARPPTVEHFHRWARLMIGWVKADQGEVDAALAIATPMLAEARRDNDPLATIMGDWVVARAKALRGDAASAARDVLEARTLGATAGPWTGATTTWLAGLVDLASDDLASANATLRSAVTLAESIAHSWVAMVVPAAIEAELAAGEIDAAVAVADQGTARGRANDFVATLGTTLVARAFVAHMAGDRDHAEALVHEALPLLLPEGHVAGVIDALELLTVTASEDGRAERSARLHGVTQAARGRTGLRWRWPAHVAPVEGAVRAARTVLGDVAFETAVAEGERLSIDEACEYVSRGRGSRDRPLSGWSALTPTEAKVADLVAEGLTNAQVGERLFISPRTVDTHLRRVYAKVGVSSRTELAAQAARRSTANA